MTYRPINMADDPRRAHFDYFRAMANPYLSVTVPCDISPLYHAIKARNLPFFLTLLHTVINAANDVPPFRRRIKGDAVVEYNRCLSSHTVALLDGTYCYCALDCAMPLEKFLPYAAERVAQVTASPSLDDGDDPDSLFFVSTLPWLRFTALSLPVPTPPDSNVRLTFGEYYEQDGRIMLPVNVTANHALVDGRHIADFFGMLSHRIRAFAP